MASSRVVIINEDKMLFINRIREEDEFYVIPGGTIEKGETPLEAAIREAKEETNLDIDIDKELTTIEEIWNNEPKTTHYFLAKNWSGDLRMIGEELNHITETNKYSLTWVPINQISNLTIYPKSTYEKVLKPLIFELKKK